MRNMCGWLKGEHEVLNSDVKTVVVDRVATVSSLAF